MTNGSVQSVDRAIDLLESVTELGGEATLSELAAASGLPLPTIHRLMRTLVLRGYVRQLPSRRYALGARLLYLGESAGRKLGAGTHPYLERLAKELGESANLAIIDRDMAAYVAQASSSHSMRMFTEVGRRVYCHSTGVGKILLSQLPNKRVREIATRVGMPPSTDRSITDIADLLVEMERIRDLGYGLDDGEQEVGVRCFAVPVLGMPIPTALSVSGPAVRVTHEFGNTAVPLLQEVAAQISTELLSSPSNLSHQSDLRLSATP